MSVVINEFEVVAEPPAAAPQAGANAQRAPAAQGPTPHALARIVQRQRERLARVRAH